MRSSREQARGSRRSLRYTGISSRSSHRYSKNIFKKESQVHWRTVSSRRSHRYTKNKVS